MFSFRRLKFFLYLGLCLALAGPALADQTGTIKVVIGPDKALAMGAAWSVDGGKTWRRTGEKESLKPGEYMVEFRLLPGWTTPRAIKIILKAGSEATVKGTYTPRPQGGKLSVLLEPEEALRAGGCWSLDGGKTWRPSAQEAHLAAGSYRLVFKRLPGLATPKPMLVDLPDGKTVRIMATYGKAPVSGTGPVGWLQVVINPVEAAEGGALWTVDAGTNWYFSGQSVPLDPGRYRIMFRGILGWDPARDVLAEVEVNKETVAEAAYVKTKR